MTRKQPEHKLDLELEGEKNTKFFLGLKKNHETQNIIRELTNENNDFLNTDEEI